jgi:hypothetical protein
MPLLRSVYYRTPLHPDHPRRHIVPLVAAQELLDEPDALPSCLSDHQVLAQMTLMAKGQVLFTTRETILAPQGENEVTLPLELFRDAPHHLPAGTEVVVRLVLLTGPAGHESTPEI